MAGVSAVLIAASRSVDWARGYHRPIATPGPECPSLRPVWLQLRVAPGPLLDWRVPAGDSPGEDFQGLVLRFRGRTGLTQRQLAARLGVHLRSVQAWESGVSYPNAASLQALIAGYLDQGGFAPGQEATEAEALWRRAQQESPRLRPPFEAAWFAGLLEARGAAQPPEAAARPGPSGAWRAQDWGDAPDSLGFVGRAAELARLRRWVLDDGSRLVAVLGLGGIGKTVLATRLARELAPAFERVYWRSVRNAPSFGEWAAGAIAFVSDQQRLPPAGEDARLELLLALLRERRCLLVLDNLELLLQPGERTAGYRPGYGGYGRLLRVLGETDHPSCLVLTSREAPPELGEVGGEASRVRVLELGGLATDEAQRLLGDKQLTGDAAAWGALVARYGGNGLALKVVGETIHQVFGGDIAAFLEQAASGTVFGGIRRLLDGQIERLSALEQEVLRRLATAREPTSFASLAAALGRGVARSAVLEALEALRRRSLVERSEPGPGFTLPSVVLEYVTDQLVERGVAEVLAADGPRALLTSQPLVLAQAKDYIRRAQERLIAAPLLERLAARCGSAEAAGRRLSTLLDELRRRPLEEQGYAPGNVVNLLRLLRGQLHGLDLSGLAIRQAFLQEVEAQDTSLAGAHLAESVLADAFSYPTCVALSADGGHLAAGTTTGEVCLWRVADRTLLATLRAHHGLVLQVALSDDGRVVASGSEDGTVRVWDAEHGRLLATTQIPTGGVRGVALSGDGQLVASGSHDGTVWLWDAQSGRELGRAQGNTSGVRGVALSRDGGLLASGSVDGTVRVWETTSGRLLASLDGHAGATWSVALSGDGQLVASGSVDQTVRLWRTRPQQALATLAGHSGAVWSVALSGDGQLAASASFDGTLKVWGTAGGELLATLLGHSGGVRDVALSRSGDLVASCSYDGTIRLWQAPSGRLLATLRGHTSGVRGVALSGSGRLLASGSYDGTVRLWEAATGRLLHVLHGHASGVWSVALSADGQLVASGSFDGSIKLWETETGRLRLTLHARVNEIWGVALSGDGRLVASGSYDGTMRVWAAGDGRLLATIVGHTGGVWGVALGDQRQVVASGGEDGTVKLWAVDSGDLLMALDGHTGGVWGVSLSGDAGRVASAGEDGVVRVWDVASGRPLASLGGHTGGVWSVAISSDGQLVASGSFDGLVRLWEASTGRLLATLTGHTGAVFSVALSGDRRLLASGGFDGTLRLWDTASGAWLRTLRTDRRYERLDITGLRGITPAQRDALLALGAIDRSG